MNRVAVPASAEAKYKRALEHFDRLKAETDGFLEPGAYRTRHERSSDLTTHRFYLEFGKEPPSDRWGLIFGDGVHCLRCALDHVVYAIGVKENGDPPLDERVLAFPITADEARWEKDKWRVRSLSTAAQEEIKRLQPHDGTEEFGLRVLGFLDEFDNSDKHRVTPIVGVLANHDAETLLSGLPPGREANIDAYIGPHRPEVPIMTVTLDVPSPNLNAKHNLSLIPAIPRIRETGRETSLPLWRGVDQMIAVAVETVNRLARFC